MTTAEPQITADPCQFLDFDPDELPEAQDVTDAELEFEQSAHDITQKNVTIKLKSTFRSKLYVKTCVEQLGQLPAKGESIHGVLDGSFPAWTFVGAVLELTRSNRIEDLWMATLGTNAKINDDLCAYLDSGRIVRAHSLLSCYFRDGSKLLYESIRSALAERGQRIVAARNHAKVQVFEFARELPIVLETSANLRSCGNVEQFTLSRSRELADFHRNWIDEMIRKGDQR